MTYRAPLNDMLLALNHGAGLYNSADQFRDVALGRGQFRVIRRGRDDEGGGVIYGVSDEESRLNLNLALAADLGKPVAFPDGLPYTEQLLNFTYTHSPKIVKNPSGTTSGHGR